MRVSRVLTGLALTAAAVGLPAGAAVAEPDPNITSFGFTVSPSTVAAGGTVTLNATGCEVPTVHVSSPVFDDVTLNEGHPATARVYPDAKRGAQYDVTFDCKGEKGTTHLMIATGAGKAAKGGVGGSVSGTNPTELAAGAALIAAALGAGVYLTRRRTATSDT